MYFRSVFLFVEFASSCSFIYLFGKKNQCFCKMQSGFTEFGNCYKFLYCTFSSLKLCFILFFSHHGMEIKAISAKTKQKTWIIQMGPLWCHGQHPQLLQEWGSLFRCPRPFSGTVWWSGKTSPRVLKALLTHFYRGALLSWFNQGEADCSTFLSFWISVQLKFLLSVIFFLMV